MADFVEQLPAGEVQDKLTRSVKLSHPFRRFKDTLLSHPDVREQWFAFEQRALLELARDWLKTKELRLN